MHDDLGGREGGFPPSGSSLVGRGKIPYLRLGNIRLYVNGFDVVVVVDVDVDCLGLSRTFLSNIFPHDFIFYFCIFLLGCMSFSRVLSSCRTRRRARSQDGFHRRRWMKDDSPWGSMRYRYGSRTFQTATPASPRDSQAGGYTPCVVRS